MFNSSEFRVLIDTKIANTILFPYLTPCHVDFIWKGFRRDESMSFADQCDQYRRFAKDQTYAQIVLSVFCIDDIPHWLGNPEREEFFNHQLKEQIYHFQDTKIGIEVLSQTLERHEGLMLACGYV